MLALLEKKLREITQELREIILEEKLKKITQKVKGFIFFFKVSKQYL